MEPRLLTIFKWLGFTSWSLRSHYAPDTNAHFQNFFIFPNIDSTRDSPQPEAPLHLLSRNVVTPGTSDEWNRTVHILPSLAQPNEGVFKVHPHYSTWHVMLLMLNNIPLCTDTLCLHGSVHGHLGCLIFQVVNSPVTTTVYVVPAFPFSGIPI